MADGRERAEGEPRPRCRLYLMTPADLSADPDSLAAFRARLAAALDAGDVACVLLRLAATEDEAGWRRAAEALMPDVQSGDVAFLLHGHAALAAELDADGVHVDRPAEYRAARAAVGPDRIVGVMGHTSKDAAADAAEAGADYVAFGPFDDPDRRHAPLDALSWFAAIATAPAAALGGVTPEDVGELVRAGADFLAVDWPADDGAAALVAAVNEAIDATPHEAPGLTEAE